MRSILRQHGKTLDESAFNNQLRYIVSKREAGLPLYLYTACQDLIAFGDFEKVSCKVGAYNKFIRMSSLIFQINWDEGWKIG